MITRLALLALLLVSACAAELVETRLPGFRLRSQCDAATTARVGAELTRTHAALAAWLGHGVRPLPGNLPDLPVLLFADRAAFQAHAVAHASNVATAHAEGFYSGDGTPGGGTLVLFRNGGRELTTLRHELVHYLIDQILPARSGQPVWFNEGLAVCAEDAWIDPGQVRIASVPMQRWELLRRLAAATDPPLHTITALGAESWLTRAGADRREADKQYAASYGAVLYLLNRQPTRFWQFLRAMAAGTPHDTAYAAAFADLPGGLDAAWRAWIARDCWEAARASDGTASAAAAVELGLSWLPDRLPPGNLPEAVLWLTGAARGFAQAPGYELDAAGAWLAVAHAAEALSPEQAGSAAEQAAELYAASGHLAGQTEALLQAVHAWGDDLGHGDWARATTAARVAVQLAEAIGPDELRAAAYTAYGSCLLPGRSADANARAEADTALRQARALYHAAHDIDREAAVLLLLAQALTPDDGQAGDWHGCLVLAQEAETLWRGLPDQQAARTDIARALAVQAGLHRPDRNPNGDWGRAVALYGDEAALIDAGDARRLLRNRIDLAACLMGLGDHAQAAAAFAAAEVQARTLADPGLAAYAAYQTGWCLQADDPAGAMQAFLRAAPDYRQAGKIREEAMTLSQAAQAADKSQRPAAEIADLFGQAAALEAQRGDASRQAYCLYQQAWFSEPTRQSNVPSDLAAELYLRAATAWRPTDPGKAAQALQQRARAVLPTTQQTRANWTAAAAAWGDAATALASLPDAAQRQGERGTALHQQAWCLIHGDSARMTPEAKRLFTEAVRLLRAAGDEAGAKVSASWIGR